MSDKPKRVGWTFRTARRFWLRADLSLGAKALAHILLSFANAQGGAWPTTPQLSKAAGTGEDTVNRYLEELREKGAISWEYWRDDRGRKRRKFDLRAIHIPPSNWDGLGGHSDPFATMNCPGEPRG